MSDLNQPVPPAEEQIVSSASDESFGDILSQFEQEHRAESGTETVQGSVVSLTPENIVVDIGRKMEGLLSFEQYRANGGVPARRWRRLHGDRRCQDHA